MRYEKIKSTEVVKVKTVTNIKLLKSFTDAAAGISTVWCKHQKFFQNRTATASVHIVANLCNDK